MLGVRVVLVVSLRTQLDARIAEQASKSSSTKKAPSMRDLGERVKGLRPTDNAALAAVQIESGLARSKVEAALSTLVPESLNRLSKNRRDDSACV